ncbi:peroxidase [Streptomyces sp. A7024]|uniref:Peroxidase n=1 Tax=Streptomyces coryli TaxID=1128680 RepID=A0A6G4U5Q0_9ACTN|nr:peroxidase [Streptomyces coryli]
MARGREWHELPLPLGLMSLKALREELRRENLLDTAGAGGEAQSHHAAAELPPYRTYDGRNYDPRDAGMGRAGTRFDRNVALGLTRPEDEHGGLMSPSPREVSRALLARNGGFKPAPTLNMLAAAWIQFQNHGWFSHGDNTTDDPLEVPVADGDDWPQCPMTVRRTRHDPVPHDDPDRPPTYECTTTHWWDGSQIYGSDEARCRSLRTGEGGRLAVGDDGRLPDETRPGLSGVDLTGFSDNYWVGLSMLHTLFAKEHNAICDRIRSAHPTWDDERLFHTARLVNSAVMAKIHTVEWTPAVIGHRTSRAAMHLNWYGALPAKVRGRVRRHGTGEMVYGILGSPMEHHSAPFSMTEEFVTCYRLHPLIRDEYEISSHRTGEALGSVGFEPMQGLATRASVARWGWSDLFYSFGRLNPGDITLHNHPDGLRALRRVTGEFVDLGTVDVLRDRERGVPRYTAFREAMHRRPVGSFEELTGGDAGLAAELAEVYDGRLDRVDTMVGMYAEPRPPGFAFSDTAFRVFVLMASRRLKSDRFFTDDYRPEVYTAEGLEWVDRTGMREVLLRHHPELAPALAGAKNAFAPWTSVR